MSQVPGEKSKHLKNSLRNNFREIPNLSQLGIYDDSGM
jgi:hypothetical protein